MTRVARGGMWATLVLLAAMPPGLSPALAQQEAPTIGPSSVLPIVIREGTPGWVVMATLIVATVGAGISGYTAFVAGRALKHQELALKTQLRPFISLHPKEIDASPQATLRRDGDIVTEIRNSGSSPAHEVLGESRLIVAATDADAVGLVPPASIPDGPGQAAIVPGSSVLSRLEFSALEPVELAHVNAGRKALYYVSRAYYQDGFGERHLTQTLYRIVVQPGGAHAVPVAGASIMT